MATIKQYQTYRARYDSWDSRFSRLLVFVASTDRAARARARRFFARAQARVDAVTDFGGGVATLERGCHPHDALIEERYGVSLGEAKDAAEEDD